MGAYETFVPRDGNTLILAYDGWRGTYLPAYVLKLVLEEELGYRVEVSHQSTVPNAFDSVARGRTDIFSSAWFPIRDFTFSRYDNLVKLGQVYGGKERDAYEGWMVSAELAGRFSISHVGDLQNAAIARELDTDGDGRGNLIGCPGDWVCANRHPEMLEDFELGGLYEIEEPASEAQMLKAVKDRLDDNKPALFYMLQPVGFPGDFGVAGRAIWLDGTQKYLPLSFNRVVVRTDFISNHPEAAKVISRYRIPGADVADAMSVIGKEGESPDFLTELAQDWINDHRGEVDSWFQGISRSPAGPPAGDVPVAYSPEQEDLFLRLAIEFNSSRQPDVLPIRPIRVGMDRMLQDAVDGKVAAISPDSSVWLGQLDRLWEEHNPGASSLVGASARYALSPIVIAMWEDRARELGYPEAELGWQDLIDKVAADPSFRWSHQSATTASGLLATTAEFYAGAGKDSGLTRADLEDSGTIEFVKNVEATVDLYGGESEDKVAIRLVAEGGAPLDAFVAQEQVVVFFNRNTSGDKLVAVYPKEGTFWMDHPLILLNGPWVEEGQQRAFRQFAAFVAAPEQQQLALEAGYRPGDPGISASSDRSLITPENGVDPAQPATLLQVPPQGVLEDIREVWRLTKRPANIYLVVDVSGSMAGDKLDSAKAALESFVDQVQGDRDNLGLIAFSDEWREVRPLQPVDSSTKSSFKSAIRSLASRGGTRLYDAVAVAHQRLQTRGDSERINVVVAMTDGRSDGSLQVVEDSVRNARTPVLIFTVGYGDDADISVLERISRVGGGQAYPSDPNTIDALYRLLSGFF